MDDLGGLMDVESLRQTLKARQAELKAENWKFESGFRNNCNELGAIQKTLKDLEPIK